MGDLMTIAFACPQCGSRYQADDAHAGRKGRCKKCGAGMTVPGAAAQAAQAAEDKRPAPEASPALQIEKLLDAGSYDEAGVLIKRHLALHPLDAPVRALHERLNTCLKIHKDLDFLKRFIFNEQRTQAYAVLIDIDIPPTEILLRDRFLNLKNKLDAMG
jgi:hypothetical protein